MAARSILIIFGAILTILGTFVFGLFPFFTAVGSGLGFAINLPSMIVYDPGADVIVFYLLLVLFIAWLASGVLQFVGLKSKIVGVIFSLIPLAIGTMVVLLVYTEILGAMSLLLFLMTVNDVVFLGIFPILIEIADIGLGVYFLLAGGLLGLIGSFMSRN